MHVLLQATGADLGPLGAIMLALRWRNIMDDASMSSWMLVLERGMTAGLVHLVLIAGSVSVGCCTCCFCERGYEYLCASVSKL